MTNFLNAITSLISRIFQPNKVYMVWNVKTNLQNCLKFKSIECLVLFFTFYLVFFPTYIFFYLSHFFFLKTWVCQILFFKNGHFPTNKLMGKLILYDLCIQRCVNFNVQHWHEDMSCSVYLPAWGLDSGILCTVYTCTKDDLKCVWHIANCVLLDSPLYK